MSFILTNWKHKTVPFCCSWRSCIWTPYSFVNNVCAVLFFFYLSQDKAAAWSQIWKANRAMFLLFLNLASLPWLPFLNHVGARLFRAMGSDIFLQPLPTKSRAVTAAGISSRTSAVAVQCWFRHREESGTLLFPVSNLANGYKHRFWVSLPCWNYFND